MYLKKLYLIIASSVLVLLLCISIFEFVFWNINTNKLKESYEQEIKSLEKAVAGFGPMGNVWTVSSQTSPGQEVTKDNLVAVEMLEKNIAENYIVNPEKVIGKYYKLAILPGTPLTEDLFMNEVINKSSRQFEVVSAILPVGLQVGDYIDYRFLLPKGEDYIVLAHKRVQGIYGKVITLYMTEEEIHTYQSMLIDYFVNDGSQIYATKYLEPSIQKSAQIYYPVSDNVLYMMSSIDPNITELIEESVIKNNRFIFNNSLKGIPEDVISKIISGRSSVKSDMDSANITFKEKEEMKEKQSQIEMENSAATSEGQSDQLSSIPPSEEVKPDSTMKNDQNQEAEQILNENQAANNQKSDKTYSNDAVEKDSSVKNNSSSGAGTSDKSVMDGVVE